MVSKTDTGKMIPRYLMLLKFHWENTYQGLFVPYLGGAFGVFLLTQFFGSIPKDLDEAAKMDGASHLQILTPIHRSPGKRPVDCPGYPRIPRQLEYFSCGR